MMNKSEGLPSSVRSKSCHACFPRETQNPALLYQAFDGAKRY